MSAALSGTIERVTFHNPENGFAVLRVAVKGKRGLVTVVGQTPRATAGEYLEATGAWKQDPEHGEQFRAETLRTMPPSSVQGIEKYLGSGLVKGIGPHYARKIVSVFGERTLKVIDESPSFLAEIKGIGPQRIQRIRESWRQQKAVRDIMVFLHSHGIGAARAVRIYKTYGDRAVELVRSNPYRLANDIWGVGFKTADELAHRLGVDRQSPLRAQAALRFVLHELSQEGHCGYPEDEVMRRTEELTGIGDDVVRDAVATLTGGNVRPTDQRAGGPSPLSPRLQPHDPSPHPDGGGRGAGGEGGMALAGSPPSPQPSPPAAPVTGASPSPLAGGEGALTPLSPRLQPHDPSPHPHGGGRGAGGEGAIASAGLPSPPAEKSELIRETIDNQPWLFLRRLHAAEVGVARGLLALLHGPHPLPAIHLDAALDWAQKLMKLELAPSQRDAIRQAVTQKVLVITGGPGVGKTTIVRAILEIFLAKKLDVLLAAPTGRAAKRLAESTGREAKTLHRLLEFDHSGPQRDRQRPLEADLLIVDETSMVDVTLMHHLIKALPQRACLVLVGDVDQLPSVGPGAVLGDIIASRAVPVARLTEIFRQARESGIVQAAHRVNAGELPESAPATSAAPGAASRGMSAANPARLSDFYIIEADAPAAILDRIVTLIQDRIPARFELDPVRDVQVLTPMNRSELGVRNLNQALQQVLNPAQEGPQVERFGWTFRTGDKVLQTVNNYDKDVFNGDIGRIRRISEEDQELTVDFDGRGVHYDFDELDELSLAYALTIHKSQGSEYPAVIIPLHTQHFMLLQRNLLYTGITRGKKLVVLVGSQKALRLAVQRHDTARRCTALALRLGQLGTKS